jgi:ribonuclease Z
MAQVILLGTGAALSDAQRENTYLVVQGEKSSILVDCAGSPTQRLLRAGVSLDTIDHLVLTHHHPDHIYGLPVFLMDLWLAGRKRVLHIYGLAETLRAARGLMKAFEWERWQAHGFFPVEFHRVAPKGIGLIIVTPEFSVSATPTKHLLPTIGLRFVSSASGKSVIYSSDTMVCESVVALACDGDILIHEATTIDELKEGHTNARQAGEQATRAQVRQLVLVHLPPDGDVQALHDAAAATFGGKIVVAKDFQRIKF